MNNSNWFVVLTYNPNLRDLIDHLRAFKIFPFVIVDNSEKVNEFQENIHVLYTGKNLGYTGGMNRGIQYCLNKNAEWIVVMNDDLKVSKKSLESLKKTLQQTPLGIAGPFVGTLDKKRWTTVYPVKNQKVDLMYLSGSFMAIHRNVIEKIGGFYEPYFIYYEDVEYCLRARESGFQLTQLQLPRVRHRDGSTFRKRSFFHEYFLARNHLLFVERNAPWSVKIHEILRLTKTIWEHISRREWGALVGIRDYLLRRFGKYTPLW